MPKAGKVYYKAVRPDGTSFYDPDFRWLRKDGKPYARPVTHPDFDTCGPEHYLSVATVPTDCTAMKWPCRLLTVEPVGEVFHPRIRYPNKRAAAAWRVTGELPATDALGPQGALVVEIIDQAARLTELQFEVLSASTQTTLGTQDMIRGAILASKRMAAWLASTHAARMAILHRAGDVLPIDQLQRTYFCRATAVACDAVEAMLVQDIIPDFEHRLSVASWYSVVGRP